MLPKKIKEKINKELLKFPKEQKRSAVMATLRLIQNEKGWLSEKSISEVAAYLSIPEIAVLEVATFYNMYDLKESGKFKIAICTNISCMLRDTDSLLAHVKKQLKIDFNQVTEDGKFCLKESECMGACGGAPLMVVNNQYMHENLTPEKFDQIIEELD
ncbi:MAG: NADH-quinone oxidoreductase subunit NuoE [Nitrosomonadales bacterium]|nr:NADH-quinone oxidoreductase subunit NuoE [Nitrosomonadales bacterium]